MTESQTEDTNTAENDSNIEESVASPDESGSEQIDEHAELLQEFIIEFAAKVDKSARESKLRATKSGFFFEESLKEECITLFRTWFKEKTSASSELSDEKIVRKLFDQDSPSLYYAVEGKHSIVGYVVPVIMKHPHKSGVQLYNGQPLDALNYLHPRDPIFETLADVKTNMGKTGIEFCFSVGKRNYTATTPVLSEFAHQARGSKRICRDHPGLLGSLRAALEALPALLHKARPSRKKVPLLIPGELRTNKSVLYLCVGSFVFVVDKAGQLLRSYDLKGKNRHEFVTNEFEQVKRLKKGPRVEGLELVKAPKARFLANFKLQGQRYQLLPKAFGEFCEQAPLVSDFAKRLAPYYTIFDCVKLYSEVFMSSSIVDSRDAGKYLKEKKARDLKYLRLSKGFVFVVSKKEIILECFHVELLKRSKSSKPAKRARPTKR